MHCLVFTIFTGVDPVPNKFVVVPFVVSGEPGQQGDQLEPLGEFDTLEAARRIIPAGNVCIPSSDGEHPWIVESWADADDVQQGLAAIAGQVKGETQA